MTLDILTLRVEYSLFLKDEYRSDHLLLERNLTLIYFLKFFWLGVETNVEEQPEDRSCTELQS